jgi:hypothetical protein
MRVLFVGPGGDPVAGVLRDVGKQVRLSIPTSNTATVVELWDSAADRNNVDSQLAAGSHVLYFGHGYEDALGDPPLVDTNNIGGGAACVVLAMCCASAKQLGGDAVNQYKIKAFLGFTRPVFIPISRGTWSLTPWYVAGTQLVTGANVGAVEREMRQALFNEGDRIFNNQLPDYETAVNDMFVHYGMAHTFVCLGDRSATL